MAKRFWPGLVLLALLQSGCVAYTRSQPVVEGRLLDSDGNAISAAEITLKSNGSDASTLTDSKGAFFFRGDHEWSLFLPIGPIDKINISRLLITARGQHYDVLLSYRLSGSYEGAPDEMGVVCTLPRTQQSPDTQTGEHDICRPVPLSRVNTAG
ncbi:carboxypeptidase-like regulatory domain-containing protein [Yokenella regensburgei]|uniref:carboxypeptidase-like regulatory domain-containing protein n=1 Tax=Yokenella regensburgei TaxID=158877 RepID=UPI003F18C4AA